MGAIVRKNKFEVASSGRARIVGRMSMSMSTYPDAAGGVGRAVVHALLKKAQPGSEARGGGRVGEGPAEPPRDLLMLCSRVSDCGWRILLML